jgi:F-type H+-transporting ATPase subunit gamma
MSQINSIKGKINSVKKTRKITSAMEMVAASKMRKAQERMQTSRPYAEKIRTVIAHVAACRSEYHHVFLEQREVTSRVGYIVVTTDRGLCGGLNMNLFRSFLGEMQDFKRREVDVDLCLIGKKGESFFKRHGGKVLGLANHLGDSPEVSDIIGVVKVMLDEFENGTLDAVYLVSNEFINTMTQKPVTRQLLPLIPDKKIQADHWDYIYEPDSARTILDILLRRYIESQVYQAVIENMACEQSARMVAMKNATDNAGDIIDELKLIYNKARQASITQEIAEIVGGAAAVE